MPRLQNKSYTARAPDGAGSWPEIPDIDPQLSEIDGGKTNAAFQRWNDFVRARLGGNEQQDNGRFKNIQTAISRSDGYLESVWTMQAIAGQVVTGMTLFSSTGPEPSQTVSRIAFQADVFQINTASGNKQIFSATASEVKLGDVLTVDLENAKVFIGTGTYGNANTGFYVDEDGFFSLKDQLTFDPTGPGLLTVSGVIYSSAGVIGGFTLAATTIAAGTGTARLLLDAGGFITFGTPTVTVNGTFSYDGFNMVNAAGGVLVSLSTVLGYAVLNLNNAGVAKITFSANTGTGVFVSTVTASSFLGSGASLTGLTSGQISGLAASATTDTTDASNISSGTLPAGRLSFSKTGTGDVPVDGFTTIGGVKVATVA